MKVCCYSYILSICKNFLLKILFRIFLGINLGYSKVMIAQRFLGFFHHCLCLSCVCVCVHCMQVHMPMSTHRDKTRRSITLHYCSLPHFFQIGTLTEHVTLFLIYIGGQKAQFFSCLWFPQNWGYNVLWPCLDFK